jgi:hypothetical protein
VNAQHARTATSGQPRSRLDPEATPSTRTVTDVGLTRAIMFQLAHDTSHNAMGDGIIVQMFNKRHGMRLASAAPHRRLETGGGR